MRVYTIRVAGQQPMGFATSQEDARKERARLSRERGIQVKDLEVKEVDVPTDKAGLLAYLRSLVTE